MCANACNNLILWAFLFADHEGLALARHYGADVEVLRRALLRSSCANGPLDKWGSQTMAWAEDDMAIVAEMAAEAGIALPQAGGNSEDLPAAESPRHNLVAHAVAYGPNLAPVVAARSPSLPRCPAPTLHIP